MSHVTATAVAPADDTAPAEPPRRPWWRWFTWADLALVPFALELVLLVRRAAYHHPLWLDEQMIARNIRDRGFLDLAGALDYNQSAPLGWLWAQHALVSVFGTDEYVLRVLPLLAAVGTLVLAWLAGRRWLGPVGAVTLMSLFVANASLLRYSAEVKQYTGDLFWALLLLFLTMVLLEKARPTTRQYVIWWSVAALACLFSMGAMLATPVFAVVVVATAWLRAGWRTGWNEAFRSAWPFLIWFAVFAVHYLASLRYVVGSDFMAIFWGRRGYPPARADKWQTLEWAWDRLTVLGTDPLHLSPPGTGAGYLSVAAPIFWLLFLLGCAAASYHRRPWGALLAGVPLLAFLLAFAEVVPLYMRMAIWILPCVYVAVAFAMAAAAKLVVAAVRALRGPARTSWRGGAALVGGLAGAVAVLTLAVMITPLIKARTAAEPPGTVDERAALAWLSTQHRPGDMTIVLTASAHAVGWYADDVLRPRAEPAHVPPKAGQPCPGQSLNQLTDGFQRVILFGYTKKGEAAETAAQLRTDFAALGTVATERDFGPAALTEIINLYPQAQRGPTTGCYVAILGDVD
jgi:hypothetical protein